MLYAFRFAGGIRQEDAGDKPDDSADLANVDHLLACCPVNQLATAVDCVLLARNAGGFSFCTCSVIGFSNRRSCRRRGMMTRVVLFLRIYRIKLA